MTDYDDLSEIIPGRLFLTSLDTALKDNDVDIIVSIIDFKPFELNTNKELIYYHALDKDDFPIENYFESFYNLMEQNKDKRVLVHCLVGMSRSVTLVLSYLIRKNPFMSLNDHYSYVQEIRPCIEPNNGFYNKLVKYRKSLLI